MHLERLKSVLSTGSEHLGDIIFWALADARIDRLTLQSIWPLDSALLPDAPPPSALKLAVREAQVGQQGRLIRLGKEDETEVIFAVVREERHSDGSLTYSQEARVHLDRQREVVTSDAPGRDIVAAHRRSGYGLPQGVRPRFAVLE